MNSNNDYDKGYVDGLKETKKEEKGSKEYDKGYDDSSSTNYLDPKKNA